MSRTLNKVMLIGNVGKDPELKYTPNGIPVTSFRIATTETWKDRDYIMQEHTDWHTIVAWRNLAEIITKIVRKGSKVYIEGRIQTRIFYDKNGNRRRIVEILADNMLLLEPRIKQRDDFDEDPMKPSFYDYDDDVNTQLDGEFEKHFPTHEIKKNNEIPF